MSKKSNVEKLFTNNYYRKVLLGCRDDVAMSYSGFWGDFTQQEQITWLDQVVIDAKKLGFGNESLIKEYIHIACKVGKDFLKDTQVDEKLIRFITDSNFSPYVRTRDANRWIDKRMTAFTPPEKD